MKLIEKSEYENLKNTIKIEKIEAGGSVANTMAGIAYLKGDPSFIGKINTDEFGKIYKKSLEKINVNFRYSEKKESLPTGASIIFITPDSERTMCTYLGISSQLSKSDINEDDIDIPNTKPIRVTICGTEFSVSSWRQFAETVCMQLFQLERDTFISFLDDSDFALRGGGRQVSGNKEDISGPHPHEIMPGSGIFVGLRYSAQSLRDFIYKIAEKYKLEDDVFYELER